MSKTDEALEMLNKGLKELWDSESYKKYLDTMAKFHSYSPNNCLLILQQKPDATLVAGYSAWKDRFNRQVKKGEKGISIVAPTDYVTEKPVFENGKPVFDEDGMLVKETVKSRTYHTMTVFDISQTEGEPLPEVTRKLTGPVEGFFDYLRIIESMSPVPVRFDDIPQNGYYNKKEIVIKRGMSEEQTLKTLIHELSHARLHGNDGLDRNTQEVQAESIAYCCCRALGIDSSDYSFGYITGWATGKEMPELKKSLAVIRKTANEIIKGVEKELKETMEARTIKTNMGEMSREDYLDIKAREYGYEDYRDLRSDGMRL